MNWICYILIFSHSSSLSFSVLLFSPLIHSIAYSPFFQHTRRKYKSTAFSLLFHFFFFFSSLLHHPQLVSFSILSLLSSSSCLLHQEKQNFIVNPLVDSFFSLLSLLQPIHRQPI